MAPLFCPKSPLPYFRSVFEGVLIIRSYNKHCFQIRSNLSFFFASKSNPPKGLKSFLLPYFGKERPILGRDGKLGDGLEGGGVCGSLSEGKGFFKRQIRFIGFIFFLQGLPTNFKLISCSFRIRVFFAQVPTSSEPKSNRDYCKLCGKP